MRTISFVGAGDALVKRLIQFKLGRILFGGSYVKMQGEWNSCHVFRMCTDGSRYFARDDEGGGSFHETFMGIEAFEERV